MTEESFPINNPVPVFTLYSIVMFYLANVMYHAANAYPLSNRFKDVQISNGYDIMITANHNPYQDS
ncbi:MAG TPA: hypothetical protein DEG55_01760 [Acidaminococcaceae bacterium]|nr:hypothetical protein [Acidaminococcaceae bacterium]